MNLVGQYQAMKRALKSLKVRAAFSLTLFALCAGAAFGQSSPPDPRTSQTILHLLDYVSIEYPEFVRDGRVLDEAEYAEQVEFSTQVSKLVASLPAHPQKDAYVQEAARLRTMIGSRQEGAAVSNLARQLQRDLIAAYSIVVAPKQAPDLSRAPALYATHCAGCHGANGNGAGPQAEGLEPAPTDFTDPARQSGRSVYGLFNTITLGVPGTAMVSFAALESQERWQLAFFASQFSATPTQRAAGAQAWQRGAGSALFPDLASVVTTTPSEAQARNPGGADMLAYLRANPGEAGSAQSPLDYSLATLAESYAAYRQGRTDAAYDLAVDAYLEGFEMVEASLTNRDSDLTLRTENAMMAYRDALKSNPTPAQVESEYRITTQLLAQAKQRLTDDAVSPGANFASSLIIILREGLEAILVLAAMAAFLIRGGRRDALPWLHGGWIVALLAGGLTWVVSSKLIAISGAQRELTEGITALVAAGLLLYVGFWLHNKAHAAKWNQFIRGQITSALGRRTLFGIAFVSFLAVYREVFETVLFYQALWAQSAGPSQAAVLGGLALGTAVLVVLAWLISRFSLRLPLGLFFGISSVLMAALAVIFAGQGVAALAEAGKLHPYPLDLPSLPWLGIYPNLQGIALQLALITVILFGYFFTRTRRPT